MIYDQNAYGNMREALKALGITANNRKDYNSQFGIMLNKPIMQSIITSSPSFLMSDVSEEATSIVIQPLLTELQAGFDIQPGEVDMLTIGMPNTPPQTPIIIQAQVSQPSANKLYGTMGVCYLSPTAEQYNAERDAEGYYSLSVIENADNIFFNGPHMPRLVLNLEKADITVLQPPKHGTLNRDLHTSTNTYKDVFSYYPKAGYVGNDKAEFLVNIEGYKIR